jgi:hypothetical protein
VVHADDKRLKRFIEKLQEEGSAGFTAEPLPEPPGIGSHPDQIAVSPPGRRRFPPGMLLLTLVFVLLLAAVLTFYFIRQAELEAVTAELDNIVNVPVQEGLEQRLTYIENRLAERSDSYGLRMQAIEQGLADNRRRYEQRLRDVEQQLLQSREPYEVRLHDIEKRLLQLRTMDDNRLQDVEKKLLHMTARLDEWTAHMAKLASKEKPVVAANMAMTAEPPSALLLEPVVVDRRKKVLPQARDAASIPPRQGDWVINIASYVGKKTAARKLAYFQEQGIAAEQVQATVNSRTIYRVQVAGFDSLAATRGKAQVIGDQLGIENLWVRRR